MQLAVDDRLVVFGRGPIEEKTVEALRVERRGRASHLLAGRADRVPVAGAARAAKLCAACASSATTRRSRQNVYVPRPIRRRAVAEMDDNPVDALARATTAAIPSMAAYDDLAAGAQLLVDAGSGLSIRDSARRAWSRRSTRRHAQARPRRGHRHVRDSATDHLAGRQPIASLRIRRPPRRRPFRNRGRSVARRHRLPAAAS